LSNKKKRFDPKEKRTEEYEEEENKLSTVSKKFTFDKVRKFMK